MFDPVKWYPVISKNIKEYNPEIDTSLGTIVGDAIVLPLTVIREILDKTKDFVAAGFSLDNLLTTLEDYEKVESIATALDITPQEVILSLRTILENVAKDYGLTRQRATFAEGIVYYIPQGNFVPGTYTVNVNDYVKSIFNVLYGPVTSQVFIVTDENIGDFYVPLLGTYALPVRVRCTIEGKIGNIGPEQINYDFGTASNTKWLRAINLEPITGGRDNETDRELVQRIRSRWKGVNLGTISGYKNLLAEYNVTDVYIAGPGDPFMQRAINGAIDIYIRDYSILSERKTINLTIGPGKSRTVKVREIFPEYMYVRNVISDTTGITINKSYEDSSVLWKWSTRANDEITITNITGNTIENIDVIITYNATVANIQRILQTNENRILGLDVMVREAWPLSFKVKYSITVLPGYSFEDVRRRANRAIYFGVESLPLGSKVSVSDLINIVEDVPGVDSVLTLQLFLENTEVERVQASNIEFLKVEII